MHPLQLLDPFLEKLFSGNRPVFLVGLFLHILQLLLVAVTTQLIANALQLLLQEILPLLLVDLRASFSGHLVLQLGELQFALQELHQQIGTLPDVIDLQQLLFIGKLHTQIAGYKMDQKDRILDVLQNDRGLGRNIRG